jgi:hypothetical protein
MSPMTADPNPHADESTVGPHGAADDHGDTHGHDDHAHGTEALGPINVASWAAAALGIVLGLVIVFAFIQAAG